ncbi:MAG: hypothetical protein PWP37_910 [Thermotogota bacterium]|nr:hypothetical protein [Thermotogota bacterium]MDK2864718.1 hypothetical protein [Thermotogota bacterium]HCZ06587.1 hypothetical protein [Thermotogota bacterium]
MNRKRFSKLTGREVNSTVVSTHLLLTDPGDLARGRMELLKCHLARNDEECVMLLEDPRSYRTVVIPAKEYRWMEITLYRVENPGWWDFGGDLRSLFLVGYTNRKIGEPLRRYYVGTLHFERRSFNLIDSLGNLKKIESIFGR